MKRTIFILFILIVPSVYCSAFVPQPTPNIVGATGLIRMPSADVIQYKNINFGFDIGSNLASNESAMQYKFNLGAFPGMEIGVVGMDNQHGMLQEGVFVNIKYSLATDTSPYPLLLAIGVENLASFNRADVYMVATRYFSNSMRLHFGFLGDFPGDRFRPLGALGFDSPIFSNERLYFLTDMLAGENISELNMGFRWYINDQVALNLTGVNILADDNRKPEDRAKDKDQKTVLIGFSWINPL